MNRTGWRMRVTRDEVINVGSMSRAHELALMSHGGYWVTQGGDERIWSIGHAPGAMWIRTRDCGSGPRGTVRIPFSFVREIIERLVAGQTNDTSIEFDPGANVLLAVIDGCTVIADPPEEAELPAAAVPVIEPLGGSTGGWAQLSWSDFVALVSVVSDAPPLERGASNVLPHAMFETGDRRATLTMDWSRFGHGRITASVPAVTVDVLAARFQPLLLERARWIIDSEDDVRMFIDPFNGGYLCLSADSWGARIALFEEHAHRSYGRLADELERFPGTYDFRRDASPFPPTYARFGFGAHVFDADIIPIEGSDRDMIRLSTIVAAPVGRGGRVRAEVNRLNDLVVGPVFVLDGDVVRASMSFPATEMHRLHTVIERFDGAREKCLALAGMIPLLSEN